MEFFFYKEIVVLKISETSVQSVFIFVSKIMTLELLNNNLVFNYNVLQTNSRNYTEYNKLLHFFVTAGHTPQKISSVLIIASSWQKNNTGYHWNLTQK